MTRADKIAAIKAFVAAGGKLDYCEYIAVDWGGSGTVMRYYGHGAYSRFAPFVDVKTYTGGAHIDARILGSEQDPFKQFELQPDITTQDIAFEFDDIDKEISGKFDDYGTSRMRMYHYFPLFDLNEEVWMGQLHKSQIQGYKTYQTTASNGRRARETKVPSETHQFFCPATFGRRLTTQFANETGLCPVNDHLGGPIGAGTATDCSRLNAAVCNANTGATDDRYWGGWTPNAVTYVSDPHLGFSVTSKGNTSILGQSKRWLAGRKHVTCTLIQFVREPNNSHPELGFIRSLWEVGLGPFASITNVKINDQAPNPGQWATVLGNLGQGRVWTLLNTNLSGTGLILAVNGLGNPSQFDAQSLHAECDALGYSKVAVFTDDDPVTYTRIYTDDRLWWALEVYTNQRAGMGMSPDEFWIGEFITEAAFNQQHVNFTRTVPEPGGTGTTTVSYPHRRSTYNQMMEGTAFDEQVVNICRSGRITPPFLYQGKYGVSSFRAFTSDELTAAPVFTDAGSGKNIESIDGLPNIQFSEIPDDTLVNKIKLSFEEFSNKGLSRPIECDDKDQQLRAGRAKGIDNFWEVSTELSAYGVDELNEAVKVGFSWLWFGQFNEGGIYNNWRGVFYVPYAETLGLRRYQAIKLVSDLNTKLTPDGDPFVYFQLLDMKKVNANLVAVTVQGYNRQKMEAFESVITPPGAGDAMVVSGAGTTRVNGTWPRMGTREGYPWYQKGTLVTEVVFNSILDIYQWRMDGLTYVGNSGVDATSYPWDETWAKVNGIDPVPTVTNGAASPDPAEVPLIPPVDTNIAFGTLDQGVRTLTVPIDVV